jgi:hypothetical protein
MNITADFLFENGIFLGKYNVYYHGTDVVDYSFEYYEYEGKQYQIDNSKFSEVFDADFRNDFYDLENLFGFTENDGYWEISKAGDKYLNA